MMLITKKLVAMIAVWSIFWSAFCVICIGEPVEQPANPLDDWFAGKESKTKDANDSTPAVATDVEGIYEDWFDRSLPQNPRDIPVAAYKGQQYEAQVPDTLDLADCAANAVNFLTRCIAPEKWDYSVYHILHANFNPAILEVGHGAFLGITPKWAEDIVLMRTVSGSTFNLDQDSKLVGAMVRVTGKDGLCYHPVVNRPQVFMDPITAKAGKPFSEIFGEGRLLRAYATWFQHDKNPLWKNLAEKKINRLLDIAIPKGDTLYFRFTRNYNPWYEETGTGPVIALGDGASVYSDMVGDAVGFIVCWAPQAAGTWYKITGYEPSQKLADGLAQCLFQDEIFYDRKTRMFSSLEHGHPTLFTHCLCSMLSYALMTNNQEMIKWTRRGLDQWLNHKDPGRTGVVLVTESCQTGDSIQTALMLSRTGHGDYWEDIDRLLRNTLTASQLGPADIERIKSQPLCLAGDPDNKAVLSTPDEPQPIPLNQPLPPGFAQPDDGTERCLGAFFATLDNRAQCLGCCNGNCTRALYLAWDSIVESCGGELKINLLLNRASPWADIDSYLPYTGKLVVKVKTDHKQLLIRIPEWTDWNKVTCKRNQKPQSIEWSKHYNGYIVLPAVKASEEIVVQFPVKECVISAPLQFVDRTGETPVVTSKVCQVTLKGNTVVNIIENVDYPMFTHEKYCAGQSPMKQTTRFVSIERFLWW